MRVLRRFFVLCAGVACLGLLSCASLTRPAGDTVGEQLEGLLFWTPAQREARFARMHVWFPATQAVPTAAPRRLPAGEPLRPAWTDGTTLASYLRKQRIAGLMVLQDGRVRLEAHGLGAGPETPWTSFSVAKSITALLLGAALQDGHVASLDDPVVRYLPELAEGGYAGVSVRQLLTMTSGVRWNEDYVDAGSDVAQMYLGACRGNEAHIVSYMKALPSAAEPGSHWNYSTGETDLLGILVQRATGRTLAQYLSEVIWQPYGMASAGWWIEDECDGRNIGGSGLSATLADYARLGQFMLEGGVIDGRPAIGEAFMRDATALQQPVGTDGEGYGYLWWVYPDGSYAAVGIFGQLLYVDPARRLVIAQSAAWPVATSAAQVATRQAMVDAVRAAIDAGAAAPGR